MNEIIDRKDTLDNVATQDGQMYVNVIEFAKLIFNSTGYFVYPEVLLGRMLQIRPATIKASAVVVNPFVYKMMIKGSIELAESLGTKVSQYGRINIPDGNGESTGVLAKLPSKISATIGSVRGKFGSLWVNIKMELIYLRIIFLVN